MTLFMPPYIAAAGIANAPVTYAWNKKIGLKLVETEGDNTRLFRAINEADFRAKMGLGLALVEWVVWRLSGLTDVSDALQRVEAGWVTIDRPELSPSLDYDLPDDHVLEPVLRPLEQSLMTLGDLARQYADGNIYLAETVERQAELARHVAPDPKAFEAWLASVLRSLAAARPRNATYDPDLEVFDYAHEASVSRASFDATYVEDDATRAAHATFTQNLDIKANPYLVT